MSDREYWSFWSLLTVIQSVIRRRLVQRRIRARIDEPALRQSIGLSLIDGIPTISFVVEAAHDCRRLDFPDDHRLHDMIIRYQRAGTEEKPRAIDHRVLIFGDFDTADSGLDLPQFGTPLRHVEELIGLPNHPFERLLEVRGLTDTTSRRSPNSYRSAFPGFSARAASISGTIQPCRLAAVITSRTAKGYSMFERTYVSQSRSKRVRSHALNSSDLNALRSAALNWPSSGPFRLVFLAGGMGILTY